MSKASETKAFNDFVQAIRGIETEESCAAYFSEICDNADLITSNIKDDFMPLVGIFVCQDEVDTRMKVSEDRESKLKVRIDDLVKQVDDLKQFDVRLLKARRTELLRLHKLKTEKLSELTEEVARVNALLD